MPRKRLALAAVMVAAAVSPSCTLAKPVVCAVTAPIYAFGNSGNFCGCRCDGRGALCGLAVISAIGAIGGLVTGIVSDFNYICGYADEPARNLHDPFATNTSGSSF